MEDDDSGHADRILDSLPSDAQELVQVGVKPNHHPLAHTWSQLDVFRSLVLD
jgi:hypothetical protein